MTPANSPFQVHGPPYPTNLPFYQTEALTWLLNDKDKHTLAWWPNERAIEVVRSLYSAGALNIDVVVISVKPNELHYAKELEVTFPRVGQRKLLSLVKSLKPSNFEMLRSEGIENPYDDDGSFTGEAVTLSWD